MNTPLLSILIPTVVGREPHLHKLLSKILCVNIHAEFPSEPVRISSELDSVEVWVYKDDKQMTIGEKRDVLYKCANGLYSVQWDDDDDISDNGINNILASISEQPDCITYEERVRIDGKEYRSNHRLDYPGWVGDGNNELSDGFHFWRTPFFKSTIRTTIACSVPVPYERFGEDNMWSDELKKILKTEIHINKQIYLYNYESTPFNERYGIPL